jgi:hypothetical protein
VPYGEETVVAESTLAWVGVFTVFPLLGAGAGWLLLWSTGWLADLPVVPFGRVIHWLDEDAPQPASTLVALAVGAVVGLLLAADGWEDRLTVVVSLEGVTLRRGRSSRTLPQSDVAGAFLDGKQLVLLNRSGGEAARETGDLGADRLRAAFAGHGFRWHDAGDPHAADYTRWVPGLPGMPAAADPLLRARAKALEKGDKDDAKELRAELGKLGVVVRDAGKHHQQYRLTTPGV